MDATASLLAASAALMSLCRCRCHARVVRWETPCYIGAGVKGVVDRCSDDHYSDITQLAQFQTNFQLSRKPSVYCLAKEFSSCTVLSVYSWFNPPESSLSSLRIILVIILCIFESTPQDLSMCVSQYTYSLYIICRCPKRRVKLSIDGSLYALILQCSLITNVLLSLCS